MNRHTSGKTTRHVVLRNVKDSDGTRLLEASLHANGDVVIEGRDYGDGVERIFGVREYEWIWTIPATEIPVLLRALDWSGDVLTALGQRFSGERAADLGPFLDANRVVTKRWSRLGE